MATAIQQDPQALFDGWTEEYDQWFRTPIGGLIFKYEQQLLLDMLRPTHGDTLLDAGCGTGIFTLDYVRRGSNVVGLDVSRQMLERARQRMTGLAFRAVVGDMRCLPFPDNAFDKCVSVTAIEFVRDAPTAVAELLRVAKPGGTVTVATLNSQSLWWAQRRRAAGARGHPLFRDVILRSPADMRALVPQLPCDLRTCVHFSKDEEVEAVPQIERDAQQSLTGAFLVAQWVKPAVPGG